MCVCVCVCVAEGGEGVEGGGQCIHCVQMEDEREREKCSVAPSTGRGI